MIQLNTNEIHIWTIDLAFPPEQEQEKLNCLSPDEQQRAERFRFLNTKHQFIMARSSLRKILSFYLGVSKEKILFAYNEYKKPYLLSPSQSRIHFNLAHSESKAVYAITLDYEVGVDIEKIEPQSKQDIANRFFSESEKLALKHLTPSEKIIGFHRLWARKEAILKALGKGLAIPLSTFTVSLNESVETIWIEREAWRLVTLAPVNGYEAAVASNQKIANLHYWVFAEDEVKLDNIQNLSAI